MQMACHKNNRHDHVQIGNLLQKFNVALVVQKIYIRIHTLELAAKTKN